MSNEENPSLAMFKALANPIRLQIMDWLSDPETSFAGLGEHGSGGLPGWGGACVSVIQQKAGVSQSVISGFLKSMLQAGLLEARRHEKWTYYRINEDGVRTLQRCIGTWAT